MKAVRIHDFGGPEVLKLDDLPTPEPGAGEVRVRIHAASVNPVDYKIRGGGYPRVKAEQLPIILGRDVAGVIDKLGPGAEGFEIGEEVYAMLPPDRGGYAEFVTLDAAACARKPSRLDDVKAAAVPLAGLTAWQGLFDHGGLRMGQSVLIHGAAGGVGHLAVQFARAKGATVFATAHAADSAFLQDLGAVRVIDYEKERFEDVAPPVDLVFDLVDGETQDRSWKVVKDGGALISTLRAPSQKEAERHHAKAENYLAEPNGRELEEIARLIDAGEVMPQIDRTFPLAAAADAERRLENEHVRGKIVLQVA